MIDVLPTNAPLERIAITSPIGLRFRDTATQRIIDNDLLVQASPVGNPNSQVQAAPNRSGTFVFHDLPGLRDFEYLTDDEHSWTPEPKTRSYLIEVADLTDRFIPCQFTIQAPQRATSSSITTLSPPDSGIRLVDLFSAPSRPTPEGCAVVRTEILEWSTLRPAAWALVEVSTTIRGQQLPKRGLADSKGRLALIFPYPEPVDFAASPLDGPQNLLRQSWSLQFRAWHTFDPHPTDAADLDRLAARVNRGADDPLGLGGSPELPFTEAELSFGQELIVPPVGPDGSHLLFITPAGSPP